jgi:hypothetical protein
MPGSGPTDPDLVVQCIQGGATLDEGRLFTERGGYRWIAGADIGGREVWVVTFTRGVFLDEDAFELLARARCVDGYVHVDGLRYELVPPSPEAEDQTAYIVPA